MLSSRAWQCWKYLKELAALNELVGSSGRKMLRSQYDWEKSVFQGKSALSVYLDPETYHVQSRESGLLIFPFGINESQYTAVKKAMENQISVIQGPPGTGKTQTILTLIANLLIRNMTVQVVSGNNSAVDNVWEKLKNPDVALGFLVALLGNKEHLEAFAKEWGNKINIHIDWERSQETQQRLANAIQNLTKKIETTFAAQERLAEAKKESAALRLEKTYYERFCRENYKLEPRDVSLYANTSAEKLLRVWLICDQISARGKTISFWRKLMNVMIYGIGNWRFWKERTEKIVAGLKLAYYQVKAKELDKEIAELAEELKRQKLNELLDQLKESSLEYLRAKVFEREKESSASDDGTIPDMGDVWRNGQRLLKRYPVVLSTTFSARRSLRSTSYDYVIMDEASQVDLASGALSLTGARNAVIIGDENQLPQVMREDQKMQACVLFSRYRFPDAYRADKNSFLTSLAQCSNEIPQTLLREHYRCNPKIIGFCNQKFYNNQLLIMSKDYGEGQPMWLVQTVKGNHKRGHENLRQAEVIGDLLSAMPKMGRDDIGIVSPYRDQVALLRKCIAPEQVEPGNINTIHKFQGREKETIIFTTVDDVVTTFSDDPHLINVAVSRARSRFILVTSADKQPHSSNMADLISYILYQNGKYVGNDIRSVFDLLYKQYTKERVIYLRKHRKVSQFNSENLMYGMLEELLKEYPVLPLAVACHVPIREIITAEQFALLGEAERGYIERGAHVDFLVYDWMRKQVMFCIEVDGVKYHREGTKQHERDLLKDAIFRQNRLVLLRFPTNGSGERARIKKELDRICAARQQS